MTERKDLWWVAPASLALLVLILVSGAGNFQYGIAFGGPIIGGASIASDIFKVVALIGVFALWRNRHRVQAAALFVLFLGFTAWSMLSAVGFMSTQFATLEDNRGKTASQWQTLTAQIEQLQERRRQVQAARPQKSIQADIDDILRIPGINGCVAIDGPVTRANCPKLGALKAELGHAEAAAWLDGRLDELRKELGSTDRVSVVDPRTDSITAISGLTVTSVALFIKFFFAGLIELATAVGLWAIWSPFFGRTPQKLQEPGKTSPVSVAIHAPLRPADLPDVIEKAQLEAPVEPLPPEPDNGGTPAETPAESLQKAAESRQEPNTVVNFPKPLSKRERAKQKKERLDRENRDLVEDFVVARLDTECPRAQIELTEKGGHKSGGTAGPEVYKEFRLYCKSRGVPGVGKSHLGRFIGEFVDRARNHKGVVYGAVIRQEAKRKVA